MKKILLCVMTSLMAMFLFATAALAANIETGSKSEVDKTDANKGLVKVRYLEKSAKKLKVKIEKAGAEAYSYDLNGNAAFDSYPMQSGNGAYTVKVLENIEGNRYSVVQTVTVDVKTDGIAPFLNSTQNINFANAKNTVAKAKELATGAKSDLEKVQNIYKFIVTSIAYDKDKAAKVQAGQMAGYVPAVDTILSSKKGICFDYSSLLASMLRSQNIPTKMVFGYVAPKNVYHAWNEVYIKGIGWIKINGEIYFDGQNWSRMDSTFAAGNGGGSLTSFLGNGKNYSNKYVY